MCNGVSSLIVSFFYMLRSWHDCLLLHDNSSNVLCRLCCAGCGKSTLMMVLFRMVEPCGGAILIDGINTCDVGLTDLRYAVF
jgi:ABC-type multidrug transport system fused ATPase/permease subunit